MVSASIKPRRADGGENTRHRATSDVDQFRRRSILNGCGTQITAGLKPRDLISAAAPNLNSTVAMLQPGTPRLSRDARSCKLHDVQDPQSARPTTATSQRSTISWMIASGAGRVYVGFWKRSTFRP